MEEQGSRRPDTSLAQAGEPKRELVGSRWFVRRFSANSPARFIRYLVQARSPAQRISPGAPPWMGAVFAWARSVVIAGVEIEQRDDNLVITAALPGLALEISRSRPSATSSSFT